MIPPSLLSRIEVVCAYEKCDPKLVQALVEVESSGNPWAARFEPAYGYLYFPREHADRLHLSYETEVCHQQTSWGLMQLMGGVARELGYDQMITELCDPVCGLTWGCRNLRKLEIKYGGDEPRMVAAYNAGSVRKTVGGLLVNQRYVDKVYSVLRPLRELPSSPPPVAA